MKKLISFILICFLFPGCLGALKATTQYAVPAIVVAGGVYTATQVLDEREEYYLGRSVGVNILKNYKLLMDPVLTEYVDLVGNTVAMHSEEPETYGGYHFAILDSGEVNAFACPGGTIFITRGLLGMLNSEDELAAVLAHEVSHVNNKDGLNSVETSRWTQLAAIVGSAAAKTYGSEGLNKVVGVFEKSVDDIFKTMVVNGYAKSQELAADEKAVKILRSSGYDSGAIIKVLDSYKKREGRDNKGFFKTHPAVSDRLNNLGKLVAENKASEVFFAARMKRFDRYFSK